MSKAAALSTTAPAPLDLWLNRLRAAEVPVFGHTVTQLHGALRSEKSSVGALAEVILQDAGLTAKVLKLSNSVWFNPTRQSVSTVSRAIVLLGFELVSQIAFSLGVVDTMLASKRRARVARIMANSFHTAVQARAIATRLKDPMPEEIFVAGLLSHIGDMAFWCVNDELADALDAALTIPGVTEEEAQDKVLGFRLRQLSGALAGDWKLGTLARNVAEGMAATGSREQGVLLAQRLARAAEQGWDSAPAKLAIDAIADYLDEPEESLLPLLLLNAEDAARIASVYGAREAAKLIPVPTPTPGPATAAKPAGKDAAASPAAVTAAPARDDEDITGEDASAAGTAPDPQLQLRILRDISLMIATRPNVSDLLQMVLEGIYRGAGMDRALVALLNPARAELAARSSLGADHARLMERFRFDTANLDPLLATVINERYSGYIDPMTQPEIDAKLWARSATVRLRCGTDAFLIAPIVTQQRVIGLFYADRKPSGRVIAQEDYEAFLHFVHQANLGFELTAMRSTPSADNRPAPSHTRTHSKTVHVTKH